MTVIEWGEKMMTGDKKDALFAFFSRLGAGQ